MAIGGPYYGGTPRAIYRRSEKYKAVHNLTRGKRIDFTVVSFGKIRTVGNISYLDYEFINEDGDTEQDTKQGVFDAVLAFEKSLTRKLRLQESQARNNHAPTFGN